MFGKNIAIASGLLLACGCATTESPTPEASVAPIVDELAAVMVPVSDIDQAFSFYEAALEAELVRDADTPAYKEKILKLNDGARLVLIQSLAKEPKLKPVRLIFNTQDAGRAVESAKIAGASVDREAALIPRTTVSIGIVKDPFGNTLEFIQR